MRRVACFIIALAIAISFFGITSFWNDSYAEESGLLEATLQGTSADDNEKTTLLAAMNSIRKEAYDKEYPDPDNSGKNLKSEDYRPLVWNADLEEMALLRSAEGIVEQSKMRPNGKASGTITVNGTKTSREDIGWLWVDNSDSFSLDKLPELFYSGMEEKWKSGEYAADATEVDGYTALISSKNKSIGAALFKISDATIETASGKTYKERSVTCTVCEYSTDNPDSTAYYPTGSVTSKKVEILPQYVESLKVDPSNSISLSVGESKTLACTGSIHAGQHERYAHEIYLPKVDIEKVSWNSSDTNVLSVDSSGIVTAKEPGTAIVTALSAGNSSSVQIKVVGDSTQHTHSFEKTDAKVATCTEAGNKEYYTCTKCGKLFSDSEGTREISKADTVIAATGHSYGEWTVTKEATCTGNGVVERKCSKCGDVNTEIVKATGHKLKKTEAKAATCTEAGNKEYYTCTKCGKLFSDSEGTREISKADTVIAAKGHEYSEWSITKAATCTTDGVRQQMCARCLDIKTEAIKATGHSFGEWKVTKEATETAAGLQERVCSVCGEKETKAIPVIPHEDNCSSKKFADVESKTTHWTHLPIDYVLEKGYMAGISGTKFEPYSTVSRAMVVQVLYAMEGKPAVSSNAGFKDVVKGKWYANAVNWAASKGIVAGYTNGNFGINDPVKRQDLVAIMYKYATYKKYDTALNGDISKFADKTNISTYAVNGMRWGVGHSIISGIKDGNKVNAQPKASANRAQLAVILKAFDQNVKK